MITLGEHNTLSILRDTSVGLFLGDNEGTEVLLPNKYVPKKYEIGDDIEIFCYLDHEERPIATTLQPFIKRNNFALLQVAEVNKFGAFMDWGLEKHLLVPFSEQRNPMQEGQWYVVFCYLDDETFRLVASNKLERHISNENVSVKALDEVRLIITRQTDLGWEAIINSKHKGLIYSNEIFKEIGVGDQIKGYVKQIRPDHKIDLSLQPLGYKSLEPAADTVLTKLKAASGFLALHDKSDPALIREQLQMSKKTFKKSIGTLYRARKIEIKEDGIYLLSQG